MGTHALDNYKARSKYIRSFRTCSWLATAVFRCVFITASGCPVRQRRTTLRLGTHSAFGSTRKDAYEESFGVGPCSSNRHRVQRITWMDHFTLDNFGSSRGWNPLSWAFNFWHLHQARYGLDHRTAMISRFVTRWDNPGVPSYINKMPKTTTKRPASV